MIKRIIITIVGLMIVVGILGGIKGLQIERMIAQGKQFSPPPEPVNTAVARKETWESFLTSVGSLEAVQGVIVTAELPGKVERIGFEPGTKAKVGELLLQQDISAETAQLRAAEATLTLAKIELDRRRKLLSQKTISRSEYDNAEAQFKQAAAQADNIRAVVKKKTIRAPFDGHLGIRLVNVGQVLKEGEAIVSLQSIDPIFVNFSLPQQQLARVKPGLIVRVTTDALPGQAVEGKITAINPQVDTATRNIQMQATAANHDELLRPGMFVNVAVVLPVRTGCARHPGHRRALCPLQRFGVCRGGEKRGKKRPTRKDRAPAVCAARREARRFRCHLFRTRGGRNGREHRRFQTAKRPVGRRGQHGNP